MKNKNKKVPFFARPLYKESKAIEATYNDETYVFAGTKSELKEYRIISIISCIVAAALVIGQSALRIEGMQSTLYIIIPYMLEFLGTFLFVVFSINLMEHAPSMTKRKYAQTVKTLPIIEIIVAASALAGIIGSIIYLIINGFENCIAARIFYMILKAALLSLMIFMRLFLNKKEWQVE